MSPNPIPTSDTSGDVGTIFAPQTEIIEYSDHCNECDGKRAEGRGAFDYHRQKVHRLVIRDLTVIGRPEAETIYREHGVFNCPTGCSFQHAHPETFKRHLKDCQHLLSPGNGAVTDHGLYLPDGTPSFFYLQSIVKMIKAETRKAFTPPPEIARTNWHRHNAFMDTLKDQDLVPYFKACKINADVIKNNPKLSKLANVCIDAFHAGHTNLKSATRLHRQMMHGIDSAVAPMSSALGIRDETVASYRAVAVAVTLLICSAWMHHSDDNAQVCMSTMVDAIKAIPEAPELIGELCNNPNIDQVLKLGFLLSIHCHDEGPRASLLPVAMAAMAIHNPVEGTFKDPVSATPTLSRIWYFMRIGFHHTAMRIARHRVDNGPPGLVTVGGEFVKLYKTLIGESSVPSNGHKYIASIIAYGLRCARIEGGISQFMWDTNSLRMIFRGVEISLDTLRKAKQDAIADLQAASHDMYQMAYKIGWKPTCDLSKLKDDPSNTEPGFSFLDLDANQSLFGQENTFATAMIKVLRAPGPLMPGPDGRAVMSQIPWDMTLLRVFDKARERFLKALAVALHMTNRPARGTEMLQATVCNPTGGRLRTFYIGFEGELIHDISNNKMDYLASRAQHNIRIVPPVIAKEYYNFCIYAQPVGNFFDFIRFKTTNPYLFSSVSISSTAESGSETSLGLAEAETPSATSSSEPIPASSTSQSPWPSKFLSRALEQRYRLSGAGLKIGLRAHRQIDTAVDHKHVRERAFLSQVGDEDDLEDEEEDFYGADMAALAGIRQGGHDLLTLQTGRSLMTTWSNYGVDAAWRHNVTPDLINLARAGSRNYSQLWGLQAPSAQPLYSWPTTSPKRSLLEDADDAGHIAKRPRSENSSPTGRNVKLICDELGIDSVEWSGSSTMQAASGRPQVVLVSYNRIIHPVFLQWASAEAAAGRLKRIFLDEAHVIIDEDFRWVCLSL
ncbi:hypothetical protein OC842_005605 [Tilletia horrida]|uniref:Uncharacterized protein n=1 Tax=Tilletia horrida TaxID=155126 RepID=A0AAN6G7H6_9BASI|nr:hypothetical protein OC842_005605 [Tilletia horrida]